MQPSSSPLGQASGEPWERTSLPQASGEQRFIEAWRVLQKKEKEKEGDAFLSRVNHPGNRQHNSLPLSPLCSPPLSTRRIAKTKHLILFSLHIRDKHPANSVFPPLSFPLSIRRIVFCREKRGRKEWKRERCLRCMFSSFKHPANREDEPSHSFLSSHPR